MQAELSVSIYDFFTGERSWRQFYAFLERLPSWGHYKSALAMDEQWAVFICDQEDADAEVPGSGSFDTVPDMSPLGYSDEVARLDLIADRILSVRTAVQAGYTKDHKEPSFTPMGRPVTALDRERQKRTHRELDELDAMIRGGGLPFTGEGADR